MKATFKHSVDVLVKAYLNGTLQHCNCRACAVGNLIVAGGHTFADGIAASWMVMLVDKERGGSDIKYEESDAMNQIRATGYSIKEIDLIERAFESTFEWKYTDDEMFNGLMAVVDQLALIHKVDLSTKESAKLQFVKQ